MSARQRGQEITVRVAVDGQLQAGSFFKVKSFTETPRTDLLEEEYLGEAQTDLDIQHNGFDLAFSIDTEDAKVIDYLTDLTTREEEHRQHPKITLTVTHTYRKSGERPRIVVYPEVFLKVASNGAGGRKERVSADFEGKCKTRRVLTAPN